jgi:hypothetical protein
MNARIHIQILTTETRQATNVRTIPNVFNSLGGTAKLSICVTEHECRSVPIRIRMCFGLPGSQSGPVIICTDKDPAINKQKNEEKP